MNSSRMKTTELQMLRNLVKSGKGRPLTAADLRLLLRVWVALVNYENETKSADQVSKRGCGICRVPVSQCRC
jgi:hypothetical protein